MEFELDADVPVSESFEVKRMKHNITERRRVSNLNRLYVHLGKLLKKKEAVVKFKCKYEMLQVFSNVFICAKDDEVLSDDNLSKSKYRESKNLKERMRMKNTRNKLDEIYDFLKCTMDGLGKGQKEIIEGCILYAEEYEMGHISRILTVNKPFLTLEDENPVKILHPDEIEDVYMPDFSTSTQCFDILKEVEKYF